MEGKDREMGGEEWAGRVETREKSSNEYTLIVLQAQSANRRHGSVHEAAVVEEVTGKAKAEDGEGEEDDEEDEKAEDGEVSCMRATTAVDV